MNQDNPLQGEFVLKPSEANTQSSPSDTPTAAPPPTNQTVPSPDLLAQSREHSKPKFYSSLSIYPDDVVFQTQEADEEVILLIRRDFITNIPWITSIFLLSFVPPALFFLVPIFFPAINITQPFITIAITFYYLVLFGFTLLNFAIWYFNVGLVTNKRVIDINVPNILVKETSEARLAAISDVSYTQVGSIQGIFDYGNVRVLTETYEQNLEFNRAPSPNTIRKVIGELLVNKGTT